MLLLLDSTLHSDQSITNILSLSHSVTEFVIRNASASSSLSIVQDNAATVGFAERIVQTLNVVQSNLEQSSFSRQVAQSLTLSQAVTQSRNLPRTATSTLTLTEKLQYNPAPKQTLSLSQSVSVPVTHNITVSQFLALGQLASIGSGIIHNLNVISPLVFLDPYARQTQLNNQVVNIPAAIGFVIPKRFCVRLQAPNQTVLLPCPEWGDSEANDNAMQIKRTMTGKVYSYVKSSTNRKLKYTFQVDRPKSLELRTFLMRHMSDLITMTNWKGEIWLTYIANNPVSLVPRSLGGPCGERVDVALEFLGTKIN